MPPHGFPSGSVGGLDVYREQCRRKICAVEAQKETDSVYVTLFRGLSLREYVVAHRSDCHAKHKQPCDRCAALSFVAARILERGYVALSDAYKSAFPDTQYRSQNALQLFLQMPLAGVHLGTPKSGKSAWYLLEYVQDVNYVQLVQFLEAIVITRKSSLPSINKSELKALLGLAQSDRERELIRYSVFQSSGLTATGARKHLGLEDMQRRRDKIHACIEEAREIRETIDKLSQVQDIALLNAMGYSDVLSCTSESEQEDMLETNVESHTSPESREEECCIPAVAHTFDTLLGVLKDGLYNWFVVVDFVENYADAYSPLPDTATHLEELYIHASTLQLAPQEKKNLMSSYAAFKASAPSPHDCRIAALLNGEIVSDSESDDAENYLGLQSATSDQAKCLVSKKRANLARRICRLKSKTLAERKFLARQRRCNQSWIASQILAGKLKHMIPSRMLVRMHGDALVYLPLMGI